MSQWFKKLQKKIKRNNYAAPLIGLGMGCMGVFGFYLHSAPFFTSAFAIYGGAVFSFVFCFCAGCIATLMEQERKKPSASSSRVDPVQELGIKLAIDIGERHSFLFKNSKNSQPSSYLPGAIARTKKNKNGSAKIHHASESISTNKKKLVLR